MADYATVLVLWHFLLVHVGGSIVPECARQTRSTKKERVGFAKPCEINNNEQET